MTKTYTQDDARTIWDLSFKMAETVAAPLRLKGWEIDHEYDADGWTIRGELYGTNEDGELSVVEDFAVMVHTDGRTASFDGDVPETVRVLARAMMGVVGPYLRANAEW